jgi:uncharacterized membrane protein YgcG
MRLEVELLAVLEQPKSLVRQLLTLVLFESEPDLGESGIVCAFGRNGFGAIRDFPNARLGDLASILRLVTGRTGSSGSPVTGSVYSFSGGFSSGGGLPS